MRFREVRTLGGVRRLRVILILTMLVAGVTRPGEAVAAEDWKPPFVDYCQRLAQEVQGRKHGFLAGNVTYYVGGFHASWRVAEDETIGSSCSS